MDFKSISDLEKYLQKQISESLQTDVAEKVKELMRKHIQIDVYQPYTPTDYIRTGQLLNDCETSMVADDTLELKNTRTDNETGKYIVPVIEYSKGYEWGYSRNLDEEIGPRPFVENTYIDLKSGKAKQYLKISLEKRGFKVEG